MQCKDFVFIICFDTYIFIMKVMQYILIIGCIFLHKVLKKVVHKLQKVGDEFKQTLFISETIVVAQLFTRISGDSDKVESDFFFITITIMKII